MGGKGYNGETYIFINLIIHAMARKVVERAPIGAVRAYRAGAEAGWDVGEPAFGCSVFTWCRQHIWSHRWSDGVALRMGGEEGEEGDGEKERDRDRERKSNNNNVQTSILPIQPSERRRGRGVVGALRIHGCGEDG